MSEFIHLSGPLVHRGNPNGQWIDFMRFERAVDELVGNVFRSNWCVAGGSVLRAITAEPMSDIDVFCCEDSYAAVVRAITERMDGEPMDEDSSVGNHMKYKATIHPARGVKLPVVYDVIDCGDAESPEVAIQRFDFRCLKMYYDGFTLRGDPNAMSDIVLKRLVFDRPVSKRRVNKYAALGFTVDPVSLDKHGYTDDKDPWRKHFGYTSDPKADKFPLPPLGGAECTI